MGNFPWKKCVTKNVWPNRSLKPKVVLLNGIIFNDCHNFSIHIYIIMIALLYVYTCIFICNKTYGQTKYRLPSIYRYVYYDPTIYFVTELNHVLNMQVVYVLNIKFYELINANTFWLHYIIYSVKIELWLNLSLFQW